MTAIPVYTTETGKRAKPMRICQGCGCNIKAIKYCGPCADDVRREQHKRANAKRRARKAEQGVSA